MRPFFLNFTAKDCGPIAKPLNGTKVGKQTTYPNEVIFSCDNGFLMRGSRRRRCTADGTWSGEGTTCKGNVPKSTSTKPLIRTSEIVGKIAREYEIRFVLCMAVISCFFLALLTVILSKLIYPCLILLLKSTSHFSFSS